MYYKLSNIADRRSLESTFKIAFRYPRLYSPSCIINGLNEELITVLTQEDPHTAYPSIWGILPEAYGDDWQYFQEVSNTLNMQINEISSKKWCLTALQERRCLIIVTGFFTSYIYKGEIYPYYVHLPENKPFFIAGIYNKLEDGFITCTILVGPANEKIQEIQHLTDLMPVFVSQEQAYEWLSPSDPKDDIKQFLTNSSSSQLEAHPIAKEFFKNNIGYDTLLEPVFYQNIPKG
ncbi:SOS response-associated peptidase [Flavobacteriaceae bacterium M23B6Z8]